MKVLTLKGEFREEVLSGKKTVSIRLGRAPKVRKGDKIRIDCGSVVLCEAIVEDVYRKRLGDLTKEEIEKDGFRSLEDLIKSLRKLYKNKSIDVNTTVTVIKFRVTKIIDKPFEEYLYENEDIVEIAKKALEKLQLTPEERKILEAIVRRKSIRGAALELYGSVSNRKKIRQVLRNVFERLTSEK